MVIANLTWSELPLWEQSFATRRPKKPAIEASYRPTLIVGLGGTGCKIVQKLRRQVISLFGEQQARAFQYVVLDTDVQSPPGDDEWLGPDIFNNLARPFIPIRDIIQETHRHNIRPWLRAWWPYTDGANPQPYMPSADISQGAHAVRPIGRFAFFYKAHPIRRLLEAKWGAARSVRDETGSVGASASSGKIYLICSLAGGTGSGMFIDAAYMLRHVVHNTQFPVFSTGIFLTDSTPFQPYAPTRLIEDRMQANIYASIAELDYYMTHRAAQADDIYRLQFNETFEINSTQTPFDISYLLGVSNENGRQLRNLDMICNNIAEAIYMEIASPMGDAGRSVLDNVEHLHHSTVIEGTNAKRSIDQAIQEDPGAGGGETINNDKVRPLAYSSFAVASLTYDREMTALCCARQLTYRMLKSLMYGEATQPSPTDNDDPLEVTVDFVVAYLRQPQNQNPLPDVQITEDDLDAYPEGGLMNIERRIQDEIEPVLQQNRQSYIRLWLTNLISRVVNDLVDRKIGLPSEIVLLKALNTCLSGLDEQVREQIETAEMYCQQTHDDILSEINTHHNAKYRGKRGKTERAAEAARIAEDINAYSAELVNKNLHHQTAIVFTTMIDYIHQLCLKLSDLFDTWNIDHEKVEKKLLDLRERAAASSDYSLGFSALTVNGMDRLIGIFSDADASSVANQIQESLKQTIFHVLESVEISLIELTTNSYDRILNLVRGSPEIRDYDLFEIIKRCEVVGPATADSGIDIAIKRLQNYSAPFWNVRSAMFSEADQIGSINLVGYESAQDIDGNPAAWQLRLPTLLEQSTPVSHGVRDKLILLQTRHGAPAYAITQSNPSLRMAYKSYMDAWKTQKGSKVQPVHLHTAWCNGVGDLEDPDPSE